jgi:hypothetical protein
MGWKAGRAEREFHTLDRAGNRRDFTPMKSLTVVLAVCVSTLAGAQRPAVGQGSSDDSVLVARERSQWEALKQQDTTAFARAMGGGLVDVDVSGIKRTTPASTARYVTGCHTVSYALTEWSVAHYTATMVVSYRATIDQTCWGQKAPSPLLVVTVYERRAAGWEPVAHSETPAARY